MKHFFYTNNLFDDLLPTFHLPRVSFLPNVKTDVDQETTKYLAKTKHVVDEMSATNNQTNYLYKRNDSYVIDITRAKYKH